MQTACQWVVGSADASNTEEKDVFLKKKERLERWLRQEALEIISGCSKLSKPSDAAIGEYAYRSFDTLALMEVAHLANEGRDERQKTESDEEAEDPSPDKEDGAGPATAECRAKERLALYEHQKTTLWEEGWRKRLQEGIVAVALKTKRQSHEAICKATEGARSVRPEEIANFRRRLLAAKKNAQIRNNLFLRRAVNESVMLAFCEACIDLGWFFTAFLERLKTVCDGHTKPVREQMRNFSKLHARLYFDLDHRNAEARYADGVVCTLKAMMTDLIELECLVGGLRGSALLSPLLKNSSGLGIHCTMARKHQLPTSGMSTASTAEEESDTVVVKRTYPHGLEPGISKRLAPSVHGLQQQLTPVVVNTTFTKTKLKGYDTRCRTTLNAALKNVNGSVDSGVVNEEAFKEAFLHRERAGIAKYGGGSSEKFDKRGQHIRRQEARRKALLEECGNNCSGFATGALRAGVKRGRDGGTRGGGDRKGSAAFVRAEKVAQECNFYNPKRAAQGLFQDGYLQEEAEENAAYFQTFCAEHKMLHLGRVPFYTGALFAEGRDHDNNSYYEVEADCNEKQKKG